MARTDDTPWHRMVRERKKRRTIEGKIELAEAGDRDAARSLLALYAYQLRLTRELADDRSSGYIHPRLEQYIESLLSSALAVPKKYVPKALGLAPGERGKPLRSAPANERFVCLGVDVAKAKDAGNKNLDEVCEAVAADWGVSARHARRAYDYVVVAWRKQENQ